MAAFADLGVGPERCACGGEVAYEDWRDHRAGGTKCPVCIADMHARRVTSDVLATIPEGFVPWAVYGSPELSAAVTGPMPLLEELLGPPRVTLIGPPRTGKSSLAAAGFRAFVEQRRAGWQTAWFAEAWKLGRARIEAGYGEATAKALRRAETCGLLVIDDLGAEHVPRDHACLSDIVRSRHSRNLRTWITTGLKPEDVGGRYDAGTERRVFVDARRIRLGRL